MLASVDQDWTLFTFMKFSANEVASMLLHWSGRHGPLHRQLSDGLRELIEVGELPVGAFLPSERSLSAALTVSRTTVVAAYETLNQEGRLERRQGSGTRIVQSHRHPGARETVSASMLVGDHTATQFMHDPLATINLSNAALPCLPIVPEAAASLTREDYRELGTQYHGYHPLGLPQLRHALARLYCDMGLPTTPDQILVTSGAQQALELVVSGCLQPGDTVVVEEPTYRGALEAFKLAGCRLRSIPCDADGMYVPDLARLAHSDPPRLVYFQSAVQNPTGSVLAADRRRQLSQLVDRHHVVLVDDMSLAGTQFAGEPQPPLVARGDHDRIITIGSMSKLFWGGLRLGWIRGSARTISRLAQLKGIADFGTSLVSQLISLRLLDRIEEAGRLRRIELTEGLRQLTDLLGRMLPDWTWQEPSGGSSLWVRTPGADTTQFAQVALRYGVAVLPGAVFSANGTTADYTRLPYALPRRVLAAGVHRLAQAWIAYQRTGGLPLVPVTT